MSVVLGAVSILVGALAILGLYCAVCLGLLFLVVPPDEPQYRYVIDAIYTLTAPFVIGVILITSLRRA